LRDRYRTNSDGLNERPPAEGPVISVEGMLTHSPGLGWKLLWHFKATYVKVGFSKYNRFFPTLTAHTVAEVLAGSARRPRDCGRATEDM
jgi:hypothetical protein